MRLCITTVVFLLALIVASTNANRQQTVNGFHGNGCSSTAFVNKNRLQGDVKSSFGMSARSMLNIRGGEVLEPKDLSEIESIILSASASKRLVVIDFSAIWCGPCKAIAPFFHELSEMEEFSESVDFLKVDVDENPEAVMKWSVSAMPTFLFIKDGEVVERVMGANAPKLRELLDELS